MTDVEIINEHLAKFGLNPYRQPLYRVVWSDYQLENRRGKFRDFLGKIFIREYIGVRQVPKYNYIAERWILERWFPPDISWNPELPDSNQGSYEPVYVFQDRFGNFLQVNLKVAELIIGRAEAHTKITPEERKTEAEKQEEKEIEFYMDYLEVSPITNALHMREAVGYSSPPKEKKLARKQ